MKQIIMLDKEDLRVLKDGNTLTLNLPSGNSVDIGLEFKTRVKANRVQNGYMSDKVLDILKEHKGEFIKLSSFPEEFKGRGMSGVTCRALKKLYKLGKIDIRNSKERNNFGGYVREYKSKV